MNDMVEWLMNLEAEAHETYLKSAELFSDDIELSDFLHHLAKDEAWHSKIMGVALEYVRSVDHVDTDLRLDEETKKKIEAPLHSVRKWIDVGPLSKASIIDCIVKTERSEWNSFFLYVINTLKKKKPEFASVAAMMQNHLKIINDFICTYSIPVANLYDINNLPRVWNEKILVVDDNKAVAELLAEILKKCGAVDVAGDGAEALKKASCGYYDVIVSDIDMPKMDGVTFYKELCNKNPEMGPNFIFLSGNLSNEHQDFFIQKSLRFLHKPASVHEIITAASDILKYPPTTIPGKKQKVA